MSRLQIPNLQSYVDQERRRRMAAPDEMQDGPDRMQFMDQGAGMMMGHPGAGLLPVARAIGGIGASDGLDPIRKAIPSQDQLMQAAGLSSPAGPTLSAPPPNPEDERAEMIRGQLESRLGAQMSAAGPLGAMGGYMAQRQAQAPNPAPAVAPSPPSAPPPNGQIGALGENPFLSRIVTGSGTRTMAFPQGPDGSFGRGQDLGMQPWEAAGNPADALRSSFQRNLYGTGAPSTFLPPALAAEMALGEMRNRTLQQEGEAQRQNLLERENLEQQGRVAAANLAHRHGLNNAQYQGAVNAFLGGQGPQFAQAHAFARSLDGGMAGGFGGGGGPAVAGGPVPTVPAGMTPPVDPDVMGRVNRLMMQESPTLPNTFSYEIPAIGMGVNKKPAMAIKGGLEGKVTPEIANKLLGRFSAEKFGDAEFGALADVLGRSSGGQELRKALLSQMATDELAFRPPPVQGHSGAGFMPMLGLAGRTEVYPSTMQYSDVFPGMKLQAQPAETWIGAGLKSLKDRIYAGGLPYRQLNIGGESIPIDPGASMATMSSIFGGDAAMKRAIEARRGVYPSAYKALSGNR